MNAAQLPELIAQQGGNIIVTGKNAKRLQ